ncbi:MAG: hypothetical protein WB116_09090 [Candidatus Dormiibacterota bacterium]
MPGFPGCLPSTPSLVEFSVPTVFLTVPLGTWGPDMTLPHELAVVECSFMPARVCSNEAWCAISFFYRR